MKLLWLALASVFAMANAIAFVEDISRGSTPLAFLNGVVTLSCCWVIASVLCK